MASDQPGDELEPVAERGVSVTASPSGRSVRVTDSLLWRAVVIFGGMVLGYALVGGLGLLMGTLVPSLWDSAAFLAVFVIGMLVLAPIGGIWLLHLVMRRVFGLQVTLKILRPKEERNMSGTLANELQRQAVSASCSGCLLAMMLVLTLVALLVAALVS